MTTPVQVLNIARSEIGYDRYKDPLTGTKYGRWYSGITGEPYFGESGVPYCAMFVSWVFNQAGQIAPGLPGSYCPWIVNEGRNANATVPARQAEPGDIVLFDWGGDGVSDHVGIVEANNGSYLTTIEGNTSSGNDSNGGKVQRRTRSFSTVICVIRPPYRKENTMGWNKDAEGWWYHFDDGSYLNNQWYQIDGFWYYFNRSGYAVTGWQQIYTNSTQRDEWYYFCTANDTAAPECAMLSNGFYWIGDGWYAFNGDGHMLRTINSDLGGKLLLV